VPSFFKRVFHKLLEKNKPSSTSDNIGSEQALSDHRIGISASKYAELTPTKPHLETPQITVGVAQSTGIERDKNEDSVFTLTTTLVSNDTITNFGLYIVADGMGGYEHGELASSLAVRKLAAHVIDNFYIKSIANFNTNLGISIQELMQDGVMKAHRAIKQEALGSGTTLTAAFILGNQLTISHVGDSRAYSIQPDGHLQVLTHDHSLVKRLEELGQLTPDEASTHPKRNLLYRALGQGEPLDPDITSMQVVEGYRLLLCSDGLWGVISENQMSDIIRASNDPQVACQLLIDAANAAGGPDNISAILICISD
jgi:serine/threonine protein phosphatase PrpC